MHFTIFFLPRLHAFLKGFFRDLPQPLYHGFYDVIDGFKTGSLDDLLEFQKEDKKYTESSWLSREYGARRQCSSLPGFVGF